MLVIPTTGKSNDHLKFHLNHLDNSLVAEPIALKLRRATGDIYVDAQVFVGFMFIGAALCTWLLRSWKVEQVDRDSAKRAQREDHRPTTSEVESVASWRIALKTLVVWRRV